MRFFEYPYVIITILVLCILVMGLIGLYFTMKSALTAKSSAGKGFCGIGKIENDFEKAGRERKTRSLVYASVSLDGMKRLHSESKAIRIFDKIKIVLLAHFSGNANGEISLYGKSGFVALTEWSADEITALIERCSDEINRIFVKYESVNLIGLNFGFFATASTDVSFKTALDRAKQACSMAESKKLLYYRWDNSSGKEFERKLKIENNIQNEIDSNRFFLEYQPILDAKTDKIIGAEVLSRLNSPTEGVLTPRSFLSAVNNVGLSQKFDYYIFEKNCKWIASAPESRMKYVYTVNFSRSTLCDPHLADTVIATMEQYKVKYSCIAVEVLEDKSLDESERSVLIRNLSRLKEKGIQILLDDFGKGYTSFSDLAELAINIVKIDKAITHNATTQTGLVILQNIIRTAHDLGFMTLCEGIETEEQKQAVVAAGCDMLQGFHFYRPMPVTQLETLFLK